MMPTIEPSAIECQKTKRKIMPSLPTCSVAAVAMVMDCASTILPITPPALFAAHHQHGIDAKLLRGDLLQAAEERVGGSVAAGERDAEPAEECAEERIEPAGAGEGQAEDGIETGVARNETEAEHERDGDHGEAHADERAPECFQQRDGAHAEEQAGKKRGEEAAGAGGREPVEIVAGGFGCGFRDDGPLREIRLWR